MAKCATYEQQADGYDAVTGGGLFAMDEPVLAGYLDGREPGVALDAACETGRFAEFLSTRGHRVIGVDSSPDMLAHARRRVPDGEFHVGELDRRLTCEASCPASRFSAGVGGGERVVAGLGGARARPLATSPPHRCGCSRWPDDIGVAMVGL